MHTDQEILQKAVSRAKKNGYILDVHESLKDCDAVWNLFTDSPEFIIFSHSFAKAFWGEGKWIEEIDEDGELAPVYHRGWRERLQQMVLEENPIQYLGRFI
jgi:hypothetical protein